MLIEAAKGGHTTVVQMLIDYPNSLVTSGALDAAALDAAAAAADGGLMSSIDGGLERVPPPGSEAVPPPVAGSTKVTKLRPSMRSNGSAVPMSAAGTIPSSAAAGSSSLQPFMQQPPPAALSTTATSTVAGGGGLVDAHGVAAATVADYDMLHGTITNPILEDLERKGLDAKSYIQTMLRRTEGSSKEEQIYQKEQILAELQRVEKELQEKAQAQHLLNEASNAGINLKNYSKIQASIKCFLVKFTAIYRN